MGSLVLGISTEIGRGHPHYLDCVWQVLSQKLKPDALRLVSVFDVSQGLSSLGWRALRQAYLRSAGSGAAIRLYNSLRRRQHQAGHGLLVRLLGHDLRRAFADFPGICLVEHQLVARLLSDQCRVWFLHADVAAPAECAFPGPEKTLVPLEHTEQGLTRGGCPVSQLLRIGLMVEPNLVPRAREVFPRRLARLESDMPLTVGFFISGAYPTSHGHKLLLGAKSVLEAGMKAVVFCGTREAFLKRAVDQAREWDLPFRFEVERSDSRSQSSIVDRESSMAGSAGTCRLLLVGCRNRQDDTSAAVRLLPGLDAFVAASHERTNWALGLGLPMFALFPMVGTHAALNYEFAFRQGVAYPLPSNEDARALGSVLNRLRRTGALADMARMGFGRFAIDGAARAAEAILQDLEAVSRRRAVRTDTPTAG